MHPAARRARWSLAAQLRLGAAAAALLVLAVSVTVALLAGNFERSAQRAQDNLSASAALAEGESAVWQLRYGFPKYVLGDAATRRAIVRDQGHWYTIVEGSLERYARVVDTQREAETLTELRSEYLRYKAARPKFFELHEAGGAEDAADWAELTTTPYGASTVDAFQRQIALVRDHVAQDVRDDARQVANARYAAGAVSALLMLLLAVGFYGALRVLRPIRELRDEALRSARERPGEELEASSDPNEVTALVGSFRMMSRSHTASLQASRARLDFLLGATPAMIFAARATGDHAITFLSTNVLAVLGYEPGDFLADPGFWAKQLHPDDRDRALAELNAIGEGVRASEFRYRHHDGSWRSMRAECMVQRDASGNASEQVGYWIDVTELKRVEQMKSEFVSTVSHELRTPLTSIRGSLGLLLGGIGGSLPEKGRGLVEIASSNCDRLIRLVNDILDLEKMGSGQMKFELRLADLGDVAANATAANEGIAGAHQVKLRLSTVGAPAVALVDPDRLHQAITNFISNAVKFSPAGSAVDIVVERRGARARIEVRDRGPGIPLEFRGRMFQQFSQADGSDARAKGGTGLGLCISKGIVERLGGTVGYDTVLGAGSTFFIELAAAEVPLQAEPAAA